MALSFLEGIYFTYIFLGLYVLILTILMYLQSRKNFYYYPKMKKFENVSIVMPCFNEGESIGKAIEHLLRLNWPKDKFEIIVVDDKSTDNSADVVRKYEKKYNNVRLIVNRRNSGGAAEPTNIGIKNAKYDYIAIADADSFPEKDALKKMIGVLQEEEKTGVVTLSIRVKNRDKFVERLQAIEYTIIAFTRKLLDCVGRKRF
jgi:cellulose synthase/poly-beta-1,6-N-acetylglucosamine synthase-like glycosyltransferase